MPTKPGRPCRYPACPAIVTDGSGYCTQHQRQVRQQSDARRGTSTERGYDSRWRRVRIMHLTRYPLCHDCEAQGRITAASEVHHITPLAEGGTHDESNLMSLCKSCHSTRTARESGWGDMGGKSSQQ